MILPEVTARDLQVPLSWLSRLDEDQLRVYLRHAIHSRNPLPFRLPKSALFSSGLAEMLSSAAPGLLDRLREVLPLLVAEWRPQDPPEQLDDLLVLCAFLRCTGAAGPLHRLLKEGFGERAQAMALRQRALSVLAGFGLQDRLVPAFLDALHQRATAAVAWRALAEHDLSLAVEALPGLLDLYGESGAMDELEAVTRALLFSTLDSRGRRLFMDALVWEVPPEALGAVLDLLATVGLGLRAELGSQQAGEDRYYVCERPPGEAAEHVLGPLRSQLLDPSRGEIIRLPEERWMIMDHAAWSWVTPGTLRLLDEALSK